MKVHVEIIKCKNFIIPSKQLSDYDLYKYALEEARKFLLDDEYIESLNIIEK